MRVNFVAQSFRAENDTVEEGAIADSSTRLGHERLAHESHALIGCPAREGMTYPEHQSGSCTLISALSEHADDGHNPTSETLWYRNRPARYMQ